MTRLVYNQVWEDYDVDRTALDVGANDVVLMITSGGCNVLNTLIEGPSRIVAIDTNAEQRDLLASKIDLVRHGEYGALWRAYGIPAQRDRHSIYRRGSYGRFAWVRKFIQLVSDRRTIRRFAESSSMDEQRQIYLREIEPRLFSPAVRVIPAALAGICGMHWRQVASTLRYGRFLLASVCRDQLRHVMTSFPIRDNYYWHQILMGEYAGPLQCPPYLQRRHFGRLRDLIDRVDNRHGEVIASLRAMPPAIITKANLLDMPDFLSPARRLELFQEVRRVCAPGARILHRSFAPQAPLPVAPIGLHFEHQLSQRLTLAERTASYGGVHLYTADCSAPAVTPAVWGRTDRPLAARGSRSA